MAAPFSIGAPPTKINRALVSGIPIRRLRPKVESSGRAFVETIWNVGYRFKALA